MYIKEKMFILILATMSGDSEFEELCFSFGIELDEVV